MDVNAVHPAQNASVGRSTGANKDRKFNALTWDIAGGLRMSN